MARPDNVMNGRRALARAAAAIATVIAAGGIPGSAARSADHGVVTSVRRDGQERDGVVEVEADAAPGGARIAGARVRVLSIIDDRAYVVGAADTDAEGRARVAALPRGEAWILADAPGRARASTHVVIGASPRLVTFALPPEHVLDVAVRDDLGAAVADAELEVAEPGDPLPVGARAGPDGRARVGRLGPGPWRVSGRAPGWEDATAVARRDGEAVALVLRKLGAIRVHVVGPDGGAAARARVSIAGPALWPPRTADADAAGDIRIASLEAGTYALRATRGDDVSPIDLDVAVGRGQETSAVLRLARGRFASVRATDGDAADADPVAGARVTLAEGGLSPFPLEATTDAAGLARIGPFAPGPATLTARADGFVARGAVAVPDPPPPEIRVALVRAGVVTGRVVDARGDPIAGASIEIVGTDLSGGPIFDDPRRSGFRTAYFDAMLGGLAPLAPAGELGVVPGPVPPIPYAGAAPIAPPGRGPPSARADPWITDDDGTFRASPASPGRVRAIARSPEYVEARSDVVALAPGGEAHVEIVMSRGGSLEGRVLDARDQPVEGARVVASATAGTLERATSTASDGSFAFAALPASVDLTVSADEDQPETRLTVAVPEGGRNDVVVHLPEKRGALQVSVVDDRGDGVDDAQVSASSLAADLPLRTTAFTDAQGDAALQGARGLPLRVEVRAPSRAPRVVTTGGTEDSLRIELAAAESAEGEVVDARGRDPVAGAEVTLRTDLGVRRTRTNGQGAFSLSGLAAGGARMTVRARGFAPFAAALEVPDSGGRRPYEIPRTELQIEGVVEGDVVDARGDPVAGARVAAGRVPAWLPVGPSREADADYAVTGTDGRFSLHEVPEGPAVIEAYAPGIGRARSAVVAVVSGRTADGVHLIVAPDADAPDAGSPSAASGGVAVTLGETSAPAEVVLVSVVDGSEAERAGLAAGDALVSVDGAPVHTIEEARARLNGPIANDVLVTVERDGGAFAVRVPREAVRR